MPSPASLTRKVSKPLLRQYFVAQNLDLPDVDWEGPTPIAVMRVIDELPHEAHQRVIGHFGRIAALGDDAGQNALAAASKGDWNPDGFPNPFARAFAAFVKQPALFRRAEEIRYTDDHRRGKQWDGFRGDRAVAIKRDVASVQAFRQAVRAHFRTQNVHVDLFDRHRKRHRKDDVDLIQATVYVEGAADQMLTFTDGELDLRDYRPVVEASLTYEPETGTIEVVGKDKDTREQFVRAFATSLLGTEIKGERLPFRRFDLEGLRRVHEFPTDAEDGIEHVRVLSLRLMPLDDDGARVTLERMRGGTASIWEMASSRFSQMSPLLGGWRITQAKLAIKFHSGRGESRGKTLPVVITMPHGCDLKDRTERERIIGEKYLQRWGLLRELEIRA
jgi:hypothetical protein